MLYEKISNDKQNLPCNSEKELELLLNLEYFLNLLNKHIDLIDRRLLKGEKIPHQEKIFSVFEPYTEMIKKGKLYPNVELGKNVAITTDQFNLIVDYKIMDFQTDNQVVIPITDQILNHHNVCGWSFDKGKGFYSKTNKELLKLEITQVVMPKKGRLNQQEKQEENHTAFKNYRYMIVRLNQILMNCRIMVWKDVRNGVTKTTADTLLWVYARTILKR